MVQQAKLIIQKQGGLWSAFRKYGLLRIVDRGISLLFETLARKLYKPRNKEYGLLDALLCPKDVYWWVRHTAVANQIRRWGYRSILDVGGGSRGISAFLDAENAFICVVDLELPVFPRRKDGVTFIRADACRLPFKSKSFDITCSVAVLAQIAEEQRPQFLSELKRVGNRSIFFSEAVQDKAGIFRGAEWETRLFKVIYARERMEPPDEEMLKRKHIDVSEISDFFPYLQGIQNSEVAYKYVSLAHRPILGFFTGLMYYFIYKKKDNSPPYRSVVAYIEE